MGLHRAALIGNCCFNLLKEFRNVVLWALRDSQEDLLHRRHDCPVHVQTFNPWRKIGKIVTPFSTMLAAEHFSDVRPKVSGQLNDCGFVMFRLGAKMLVKIAEGVLNTEYAGVAVIQLYFEVFGGDLHEFSGALLNSAQNFLCMRSHVFSPPATLRLL